MIIKMLGLVAAVVACANICAAQSSAPQATAILGKSVGGVQLSITLSNDIVAAREAVPLSITITNSSTNSITLGGGFGVVLMGDAGKRYQLVTPVLLGSARLVEHLEPGESRNWGIPVKVRGDVKPGNYTLEATKSFSFKKGRSFAGARAVSNILKVQVK